MAKKKMAAPVDRRALIASWSKEIESRCDRVRSLIGERHWLSDGRHKEVILAQQLSRYVLDLHIRGGFILSKDTKSISPEIDIYLATFSSCPPILNEESSTIAFSESIAAVIEVKSTLSGDVLKDVVDHFKKVRAAMNPSPFGYWYGGYFFRSTLSATQFGTQLKNALRKAFSGKAYDPIQKICFSTLDGLLAFVVPHPSTGQPQIKIFEADKYSFPLAIADLVGFTSEWLSQDRTSNSSSFEDLIQGISLPAPTIVEL